jgi:hypothetical protein
VNADTYQIVFPREVPHKVHDVIYAVFNMSDVKLMELISTHHGYTSMGQIWEKYLADELHSCGLEMYLQQVIVVVFYLN